MNWIVVFHLQLIASQCEKFSKGQTLRRNCIFKSSLVNFTECIFNNLINLHWHILYLILTLRDCVQRVGKGNISNTNLQCKAAKILFLMKWIHSILSCPKIFSLFSKFSLEFNGKFSGLIIKNEWLIIHTCRITEMLCP